MAHVFEAPTGDALAGDETLAGSRVAVRILGCALAMLLVCFLVIGRSSAVFRAEGAETSTTFRSGTVSLTDDDEGATMFDLPALVPGQTGERCIEVSYDGSVERVKVALRARGGGPLASALQMSVEAGAGGSFDGCEGFLPDRLVYGGTLAAFLGDFSPTSAGLSAFSAERGRAVSTFRFSFTLDEALAEQGAAASAVFFWTATPS